MLTPSSRRCFRRYHRHLQLCRRPRRPWALDGRGHRQRPSDQKGLSRGILDSADGQWYASQAIVTDRGEVRAMRYVAIFAKRI
jgi:hypothetical protein